MSNGYVLEIRAGIVRAHSIKRLPESEARDPELINDMKGTPWKPHPGRLGHKIQTIIDDDVEEDEYDIRQTVIDVDEDIPGVAVPGPSSSKHRAFSALLEDMATYGATQKRRECHAIGRGWERPCAPSEACRDRVLNKLLEDGDRDGRVAAATKRIISMEDSTQEGSKEETGDVLYVELSRLIK